MDLLPGVNKAGPALSLTMVRHSRLILFLHCTGRDCAAWDERHQYICLSDCAEHRLYVLALSVLTNALAWRGLPVTFSHGRAGKSDASGSAWRTATAPHHTFSHPSTIPWDLGHCMAAPSLPHCHPCRACLPSTSPTLTAASCSLYILHLLTIPGCWHLPSLNFARFGHGTGRRCPGMGFSHHTCSHLHAHAAAPAF